MKRAALAGILIAVGLASAAVAASISAQKGQVGGKPTLPLGKPDEGTRTSPDFVIGRGKTYGGVEEQVAYGWRIADDPGKKYCVWIEYLPDDVEYGTCASPLEPLQGAGKIQIDAQIQGISKPNLFTTVGGRIAPDVAAVRVFFKRSGSEKQRHTRAVIGQVDGALQQKLKQPAPFGYFDAKVRGLAPFRSFRVQALDSDRNVIGADRHPFG